MITTHPVRFRPVDKPDTNYATDFYPKAIAGDDFWLADYLIPRKRDYFQYLREMNQGKKNGPSWHNDSAHTFEMNVRLIDSLASAVDLSVTQRAKARGYFMGLDTEKLGLKIELDAFCTCAYVLENDEKNERRRAHPNVPVDRRDPLFEKTAQELGLTQKEIQKTFGKLQHLFQIVRPKTVDEDRRDQAYEARGRGT